MGISGGRETQVEMVGSLVDDDGREVLGDRVADAASAPGVEVTVREDDVRVGGDVESTVLGGDPAVAGRDAELLLATGGVLSLDEGRRGEEVLDTSGTAGQDELRAGLVVPGLVSEAGRRGRIQVVASEGTRGVVVHVRGGSERSKDVRVGNLHGSGARGLDGPSGQGLQEAGRIGVVSHGHVGNGVLNVVEQVGDIVGGSDGRAELERLGQGRIRRGRHAVQSLEGGANASRAGSISTGVVVGDNLVEAVVVGVQSNELDQRRGRSQSSGDDMRVSHTEPSSQHTTVAATEGEDGRLGVLGVGLLEPSEELGVVSHSLLDAQKAEVLVGEGVGSEGEGFTVETVLSEDHKSGPLLGEFEHESRVAVEHHDITLISSVEEDGVSRLVELVCTTQGEREGVSKKEVEGRFGKGNTTQRGKVLGTQKNALSRTNNEVTLLPSTRVSKVEVINLLIIPVDGVRREAGVVKSGSGMLGLSKRRYGSAEARRSVCGHRNDDKSRHNHEDSNLHGVKVTVRLKNRAGEVKKKFAPKIN